MMDFVPAFRALIVAALVVVAALVGSTIVLTLFAVWLLSGGCEVKCAAGETARASVAAPVSPRDRFPGAGLPARVFFPNDLGGGRGMSYREISVAGLAPARPRDQALPLLQWVDVDQLVIDERYQRPLGPRNLSAIQRIADEFDWMQFAPVLIAPADFGRFAVIDGQHRVHAAVLCGITRVPAQVVLASAADQARAFAGVNSKAMPITAHQVYRAALVAREPWAERCMAVVEAGGCTLATANPSAKDRKPRVLYQVGSVRKMVVQRGQADALVAVLKAIVAIDSKGRVPLYTDYILSPLVNAIHGDDDLMRADLAGFLAANDPFKVLDKAAAARLEGGQVSGMQAMRKALQRWTFGMAA